MAFGRDKEKGGGFTTAQRFNVAADQNGRGKDFLAEIKKFCAETHI